MTLVDERTAFGNAIRRARNERGLSLQALAAKFVAGGLAITYQGIQGWESGESVPEPEKVFALERCLNLPPGRLSRLLGYVPLEAAPALSVPDALAADAELPEVARRALLAGYVAAITEGG